MNMLVPFIVYQLAQTPRLHFCQECPRHVKTKSQRQKRKEARRMRKQNRRKK